MDWEHLQFIFSEDVNAASWTNSLSGIMLSEIIGLKTATFLLKFWEEFELRMI